MCAEQILNEIDATLEQLIRNAETMSGANFSDLAENEIDAFQKTQESLLHHLMRMDQAYETNRKSYQLQNTRTVVFKIQEKYKRFEKLKSNVNQTIRHAEKKLPFFSKRRKKRLLPI